MSLPVVAPKFVKGFIKERPMPYPGAQFMPYPYAPYPVRAAGKALLVTADSWRRYFSVLPTLRRIKPYTMVPESGLLTLAQKVEAVLDEGIAGHFVECGTWRGGASFLIADLLRRRGIRDRLVWMFDSFEGLPSPSEVDGPEAHQYWTDTSAATYFDKCRASYEEVADTSRRLRLSKYVRMAKGWFDESLPAHLESIGPIALLRIDSDWYESVRCCLVNLYDNIVPGGFVLLDDYPDFDGCRLAVHEFLGQRGLPHQLHTAGSVWFRNGR